MLLLYVCTVDARLPKRKPLCFISPITRHWVRTSELTHTAQLPINIRAQPEPERIGKLNQVHSLGLVAV